MWYCKRCQAIRDAQKDWKGRNKVRVFRNGYVAVFLTCGHTAAVRLDKVPAGR